MKLIKNILEFLILMLIVAGSVFAGLTAPGYNPAPSDGTVLTSTSVNFSGRINNTNNAAALFNLKIMNSSSKNGNYSLLYELLVPNGTTAATETFWNVSNATMVNGKRHYVFYNFTNATTNGLVTSKVTFNIDVNYFKLIFGSQGKINMSLDTGDINTSGMVRMKNFSLRDPDGTWKTCGMNQTGLIQCF